MGDTEYAYEELSISQRHPYNQGLTFVDQYQLDLKYLFDVTQWAMGTQKHGLLKHSKSITKALLASELWSNINK